MYRLPLVGFVRRSRGVAFATLAFTVLGVDAGEPKRPDWAGDLAYFARELPARHKDAFFKMSPDRFHAAVQTLADQAPTLSDAAVVLRLQEIVVELGDDHTGVGWPEFVGEDAAAILPLGLQWFADGWRVVGVRAPTRGLLGAKLTAVGGVPIAEVEAKLGRLVSEQSAVRKWRLNGPLILPPVLQHYGLADGDRIAFEGRRDDGRVAAVTLSLKDDLIRGRPHFEILPTKAVALGSKDTRTILWWTVLGEDRIFYAQYNRCDGREVAERLGETERAHQLPSLAHLFTRLLAEVKSAVAAGTVDTFVFDVRHNSGGASDFGTAFAEQLAEIPALNRKGAVFVVVGRRTFSSAILNAMDFCRLFKAPIVGETPGGTPNHYGETRTFTLPSSKLVVTYSTKYFERVSDLGLKPLPIDIPAEPTFADYLAGIDRPLEEIRKAVRARRAEPNASGTR